MDSRLIFRLIGERLRDRTTWVLALVVGTLINLFGQLLVPWFRGSFDPITDFVIEYEIRPGLTLFSVFLAYAFPVFVGTYSAVAVRYKGRRMEAIATLHDRCPDPVFRAESSGRIAEAGSDTRHFLDKYGVDYAQKDSRRGTMGADRREPADGRSTDRFLRAPPGRLCRRPRAKRQRRVQHLLGPLAQGTRIRAARLTTTSRRLMRWPRLPFGRVDRPFANLRQSGRARSPGRRGPRREPSRR